MRSHSNARPLHEFAPGSSANTTEAGRTSGSRPASFFASNSPNAARDVFRQRDFPHPLKVRSWLDNSHSSFGVLTRYLSGM